MTPLHLTALALSLALPVATAIVLAVRDTRRRTVAARVKWAREGSVLAEAGLIVADELRRVMEEVERG